MRARKGNLAGVATRRASWHRGLCARGRERERERVGKREQEYRWVGGKEYGKGWNLAHGGKGRQHETDESS